MLVEFELMLPEELPDDLPATLVHKYASLGPATPGDGVLCLFPSGVFVGRLQGGRDAFRN